MHFNVIRSQLYGQNIKNAYATWLSDALEVQHQNQERAEARRQKQASSSGHPHPEARLCWRRPRLLVATLTRFIRDNPVENAMFHKELEAYCLMTAGNSGYQQPK